jgi:hypothetical protein
MPGRAARALHPKLKDYRSLGAVLTDVGLSQGETHVLALLADGAAHTVGGRNTTSVTARPH